jgi:DNA mismatch endonuclease (patch repair protein)
LSYFRSASIVTNAGFDHGILMTDIFERDKRSEIMSRIRGRDTKPELLVRRIAHSLGFRFRLHCKDLPGRPDIVFPRYRAVVMVHGCFWHRHLNCKYASSPKTRVQFWEDKFRDNVVRDKRNERGLSDLGWRTMVIWECEIKDEDAIAARLLSFLREFDPDAEGSRLCD